MHGEVVGRKVLVLDEYESFDADDLDVMMRIGGGDYTGLDCSQSRCSGEGIYYVLEWLSSRPLGRRVEMLDLKRTFQFSEGIRALAKYLATSPASSLRELRLGGNYLADTWRFLVKGLKSDFCQLTLLDLSDNGLAVLEGLRLPSQLLELNLEFNFLKPAGFEHLLCGLKPCKQLQTLLVAGNSSMCNVAFFSQWLLLSREGKSSSLRRLSLNAECRSLPSLAHSLRLHVPQLHYLKLWLNKDLDAEALKSFAETLLINNPVLHTLVLLRMDEQTTQALFDVVRRPDCHLVRLETTFPSHLFAVDCAIKQLAFVNGPFPDAFYERFANAVINSQSPSQLESLSMMYATKDQAGEILCMLQSPSCKLVHVRLNHGMGLDFDVQDLLQHELYRCRMRTIIVAMASTREVPRLGNCLFGLLPRELLQMLAKLLY
ncbi:hypothetical protein BASA81_010054 [Batrachochytrium salamandrivorans]|nr:hypothetical protein BASA81_010054 [Batrachochytrium salamandrivorans]